MPSLFRRLVIAAAAFAAAGAAFVWLNQPQSDFDRTGPAQSISGTWGTGPEQFGAALGLGQNNYGPKSFALGPQETVWVLDWANGRVRGNDPSGNPILVPLRGKGDEPIAGAEDLAVDHRGRLWMTDNLRHRILVFDFSGSRLLVGEFPGPDPKGRLERLEFDRRGNLYLTALMISPEGLKRQTWRLEPGALEAGSLAFSSRLAAQMRILPVSAAEPDLPGGWTGDYLWAGPGPDDLTALFRLDHEKSGADLLLTDSRGKVRKEERLILPDNFRSLDPLGFDGAGHFYVGADLGTPEGRILTYAVFSGRSRRVAETSAGWAGGPTLMVKARVSADGRIYLARSSPEAYSISVVYPEEERDTH